MTCEVCVLRRTLSRRTVLHTFIASRALSRLSPTAVRDLCMRGADVTLKGLSCELPAAVLFVIRGWTRMWHGCLLVFDLPLRGLHAPQLTALEHTQQRWRSAVDCVVAATRACVVG